MNMDLCLRKHAKNHPERLAIGWESGEFTYNKLNEKFKS